MDRQAGLQGLDLESVIPDGDWTFVTRNAYDFRGPADAPGAKGLYRKVELHAGLVWLTAPDMDLDLQRDLFEAALDEVDRHPDLVNQIIELSASAKAADTFDIRRYALPRP